MDADNSATILEFTKMLPYLSSVGANHADLVVGSRYLPGSQIDPHPTIVQRLLGALGRFLIKLFIVRTVSDPVCGFKSFTASSAEKIFNELQINGPAVETEIIAIAQRLNLQVRETPIFWSHDPQTNRRRGRSQFVDHCRLFGRLLQTKRS